MVGPTGREPASIPQAIEELRKLQIVTDAALANLSVDDLLDELLLRVRDVFEVDTAAVLLIDDATGELVARAAKGLEEEVDAGVRLPIGKGGFAGTIAAERRAIYIPKVDETNVLNPILIDKGIHSMLGVPLNVQGRIIGVLHVGSLTHREFTDADTDLLQLVGDRVALAVHVGLYERQRVLIQTMQRSLLPDRLPTVFGLEFAARYIPASGREVGGDWYDAFSLRDGRVLLAVGDVVGSGIHAATVMGRLRNMLRAYAFEGLPLPTVIERLNAVVRFLDPEEMATLILAVFDPQTHELRIANAGHLPPIACRPGETPRFLEAKAHAPVGVVRNLVPEEGATSLPPGTTLLFYTDGLIERRGKRLDLEIERLREMVDADTPVEDLLDRVTGAFDVSDSVDDVAVLAVSVAAKTTGPWSIVVDASPDNLAQLRNVLRKWLSDLEVPTEIAYDVMVACGEACANAIEHAYGPALGLVEMSLSQVDSHLEAIIRDRGRWRDPRGYGRGRGLKIMEKLAATVDVRRTNEGTEVHLGWRVTEAS